MQTITSAQKFNQAVELLNEQNVDCWMTFVRETSQTHDPVDLLLGFGLTWPSALIVTRKGEAIAIVGRFDGDNVRKLDAYDRVLTYDTGIASPCSTSSPAHPQTIALNAQRQRLGRLHASHVAAAAQSARRDHADRFTSAEGIARRLRERKSPAEVERIRSTIKKTEALYEMMFDLPLSGMTEKQVHARAGEFAAQMQVEFGWERINCPMVNAGEFSSIGHGIPDDIKIEPGMIVHFDMGLRDDEYLFGLAARWLCACARARPRRLKLCSAHGIACRDALEAGRAALKAGVPCWTVDQAARDALGERRL